MKIMFCSLLLTSIMLPACTPPVPIGRTPEQIASMDEKQLCELNQYLLTKSTQARVDEKMLKISADCNPQHFQCQSFGLNKGTRESSHNYRLMV
jgi:hypothetical protein